MPLHLLDNLINLSDQTTARLNLGLGTTDTPTFNGITLTSDLSVGGSATVTNSITANTINAIEYNVTGTDGMLTRSNDIKTWVRGTNTFSVGSQESQPQGLTFKPDGSMMFVTGQISDRVWGYTLTTPWDITTAIDPVDGLVTATGGAPTAMYFTSDGSQMFVLDTGADRVGRYSLSPAWDVSTATLDSGQTKVLTTISGMPAGASFDPRGLEFSPDGLKLFVSDDNQNRIYEISLDSAWDLTSTMALVRSYLIATTIDNGLRNISFNNNGTRLFVAGTTNTRIYEFKLATPYSLADVTYIGRTFETSLDSNMGGMYYNDDAQKCFYVGSSGDLVREFIATPQPSIIGSRPMIMANPASTTDRVIINSLQISDSTATTSSTTGALIVTGGLGVGGEISCGLYGGTSVRMATNGYIGFTNAAVMRSTTNGIMTFTNFAQNDFNLLQLGPQNTSYPAIKRNGTGVDIVRADQTTAGTTAVWTNLKAQDITANGKITAANPIVFPSYPASMPPDASAYEGGMIFVSDEIGGATMAFSDGVNWRRVQDREVISDV